MTEEYNIPWYEIDLIDRRMNKLIDEFVTKKNKRPFMGMHPTPGRYDNSVFLSVATEYVLDFVTWKMQPYSFDEEIRYIKDKYGKYFRKCP